MELFSPPMDPEMIKREVRERILMRGRAESVNPQAGLEPAPFRDFGVLQQSARAVRASHRLVGKMPPQPPTLRARIGALLVRLVQRTLFWYTPQLVQFHVAVTQAVEEQIEAFEALWRSLQQHRQEGKRLRERLQALEETSETTGESHRALRRELSQESLARQAGDSAASSELQRLRLALREFQESTGARFQEVAPLERLRQAEEWLRTERAARETLTSRVQSESDQRAGLGQRIEAAEGLLRDLRLEVLSQERRVSILLDKARVRLPEPLQPRFEDEFRGPREEIKERLRVYLPKLAENGLGSKAMPVLDLGCGRGEWLELLREEGLEAQGVDDSRATVARCLELDLKVYEADAIEYLRGLRANCMGAVTAFHLIEHLPFSDLIDLLDETVRVLKPGGLAIFETPNPANILVASERFYFDPTHRHPLPSPLLRMLAQGRGLGEVEILQLHPWPEAFRVEEDGSELVRRFNQFFYGPQDYAITGRKP